MMQWVSSALSDILISTLTWLPKELLWLLLMISWKVWHLGVWCGSKDTVSGNSPDENTSFGETRQRLRHFWSWQTYSDNYSLYLWEMKRFSGEINLLNLQARALQQKHHSLCEILLRSEMKNGGSPQAQQNGTTWKTKSELINLNFWWGCSIWH